MCQLVVLTIWKTSFLGFFDVKKVCGAAFFWFYCIYWQQYCKCIKTEKKCKCKCPKNLLKSSVWLPLSRWIHLISASHMCPEPCSTPDCVFWKLSSFQKFLSYSYVNFINSFSSNFYEPCDMTSWKTNGVKQRVTVSKAKKLQFKFSWRKTWKIVDK